MVQDMAAIVRGRPTLSQEVQVCEHVEKEERPILWGRRNEPKGPNDSGWQFCCAVHRVEPTADAKICKLAEAIDDDPTICLIINCSVGTIVHRTKQGEEWTVVPEDPG